MSSMETELSPVISCPTEITAKKPKLDPEHSSHSDLKTPHQNFVSEGTKAEQLDPSSKRKAVIFCNSKYPRPLKNLRSPKQDAVFLKAILEEYCAFKCVIYEDKSKQEIIRAIEEEGAECETSSDIFMCYFTGHGLEVKAQTEDRVYYYYLPSFDASYEAKFASFEENYLSLSCLENLLCRVSFHSQKWLLVDTCRNNPFLFHREIPEQTGKVEAKGSLAPPPGTTKIPDNKADRTPENYLCFFSTLSGFNAFARESEGGMELISCFLITLLEKIQVPDNWSLSIQDFLKGLSSFKGQTSVFTHGLKRSLPFVVRSDE